MEDIYCLECIYYNHSEKICVCDDKYYVDADRGIFLPCYIQENNADSIYDEYVW